MPYSDFLATYQHSATLFEGDIETVANRVLAILDSVHDGLYITDGNAITLFINQAYRTISGLRQEDVLGRHMSQLIAQGLIDRSGTLLAIEARGPVSLEQTFSTGKRALITSIPCFDEEKNITLVITVLRDMTELYGLEEKYHQSEERRRSEMRFRNRQQHLSNKLIASDSHTLDVMDRVAKVARLDTTVLLVGETGVGKEQFARFIVENSTRGEQTFISINCGAIPPSLIESELFGYDRGAFTGANKEGKMGVFEGADKGTLFLDEIGELPLDMQVHLLRVLQEMKIRRVGSNTDIPVDVRIIAATNRNLLEMVQDKTFREDLYYRLNVVPILIPPLRERIGDIRPLVASFLADMNKKYRLRKRFSTVAMEVLYQYAWPGNIRELKNVVEQAVILSAQDEIHPQDLSMLYRHQEGANIPEDLPLKAAVAKFEYEHICAAYEKFGNVRAAAASLQIDSATFVRKRQKYESMMQK